MYVFPHNSLTVPVEGAFYSSLRRWGLCTKVTKVCNAKLHTFISSRSFVFCDIKIAMWPKRWFMFTRGLRDLISRQPDCTYSVQYFPLQHPTQFCYRGCCNVASAHGLLHPGWFPSSDPFIRSCELSHWDVLQTVGRPQRPEIVKYPAQLPMKICMPKSGFVASSTKSCDW